MKRKKTDPLFSERRAITHLCGHTEEFWRLEGPKESRDARAAVLAKQKCLDCRIEEERCMSVRRRLEFMRGTMR